LPFKTGSFPFVFCFEFLHHFPALGPVVREIHRVTAHRGHFYFDEEPFRRAAKVTLYRQRSKIYSERTLQKHRYLRLLEGFISEPHSDEVEHGVVENEQLSLAEWSAALAIFESSDVDLVSLEHLHSKLGRKPRPRNLLNFLLGGTIRGLCRQGLRPEAKAPTDLRQTLTCPDCLSGAGVAPGAEPSLIEVPDGFKCARCGLTYPCRAGIIMLLPPQELHLLYPDLAAGP
jgi:SAM-dependent methyltransferase